MSAVEIDLSGRPICRIACGKKMIRFRQNFERPRECCRSLLSCHKFYHDERQMAADSAAGGGGRWNGGVGCFGGFGCACRSVVAVVIVEPKRRGVSARFRTKPKSERGTRPKKSVAKPKKSVTRQQKLVTRRSK